MSQGETNRTPVEREHTRPAQGSSLRGRLTAAWSVPGRSARS